jgi:8-oxo-dGTP pyrophosphatase MutT (NUDIX family)
MNGEIDQSRAAAKDLLLAEHRYFSDSFWKNEQTGETRVNWFIGIVTASAAGLVSLTSSQSRPRGEPLRLIFVGVLFALLAFGFITLLRIIKRNIVTDGYKRDIDAIRELFSDHFDADHLLLDYSPLRNEKKGTAKRLSRRLGGLSHTVLTINSLLVSGLSAAAVYPFQNSGPGKSLSLTYLAAIGAFILAFAGQFLWVRQIDEKTRVKLRSSDATHAGGVVYRLTDGRPQYLLVGPKTDVVGEWVFPKGHIDHGEKPWQAAVREVCEETGVLAQINCMVGRHEFEARKKRVIAKYYLMEYFFEVNPEESRRVGWFEFDEALQLLSHVQNKHLLHEAERKRVRYVKKPLVSDNSVAN